MAGSRAAVEAAVKGLTQQQRSELLETLRRQQSARQSAPPLQKLKRRFSTIATSYPEVSRKQFVDAAKAAWDETHQQEPATESELEPEQQGLQDEAMPSMPQVNKLVYRFAALFAYTYTKTYTMLTTFYPICCPYPTPRRRTTGRRPT